MQIGHFLRTDFECSSIPSDETRALGGECEAAPFSWCHWQVGNKPFGSRYCISWGGGFLEMRRGEGEVRRGRDEYLPIMNWG